jgi:hypothetical protein
MVVHCYLRAIHLRQTPPSCHVYDCCAEDGVCLGDLMADVGSSMTSPAAAPALSLQLLTGPGLQEVVQVGGCWSGLHQEHRTPYNCAAYSFSTAVAAAIKQHRR